SKEGTSKEGTSKEGTSKEGTSKEGTSKEGTSKPKEPYNWKTVWLSRNRRKAVIKRLAHKDANKSCVEQWDQYKRERAGRHPGHHRPQAINEPWGPKALKYYDGMTRAQSTMFFQLRTEYIGLNHHLNKIKIPDPQDPKKVISAACSCGYGRQTVSHLFLDCPDLCVAREHLRDELLFLNMEDMLTTDGKFAADWAISYFKLSKISLQFMADWFRIADQTESFRFGFKLPTDLQFEPRYRPWSKGPPIDIHRTQHGLNCLAVLTSITRLIAQRVCLLFKTLQPNWASGIGLVAVVVCGAEIRTIRFLCHKMLGEA
ncbi:hypothetical protein FPSE_11165, partial [Fusarium pseudograminearum CS3096]